MKAKTLAKQLNELRTKLNRYGAEDVEAMNNRVKALDLLYEATRRDEPNNTMHHTYTGLWDGMPSF
jgi:hypothetical protein